MINMVDAADTARWQLPLRRVERHNDAPERLPAWLQGVPAIHDVLIGIDLSATTIFVGENGAGKSTIVEALAAVLGLPLGGGTDWEVRHHAETYPELSEHLQVIRGVNAPRGAGFLRAETMHENMTYLMNIGAQRGHEYSRRSHGEMFVDMLSGRDMFSGRFAEAGLWLLDEPESALSFTSSLALLQLIRDRERAGLQTVMATHSPILASVDGAELFEFGPWGIRREYWDRLEMVDHWRRFLDEPGRYTRHFDALD